MSSINDGLPSRVLEINTPPWGFINNLRHVIKWPNVNISSLLLSMQRPKYPYLRLEIDSRDIQSHSEGF